MSFFEGTYIGSYDSSDKTLIQRLENFHFNYLSANQEFQSQADLDYRFYVGDQQIWNDFYGNLNAFNRKQFSFNHIRPIVEMPSGHQRKNRKSTIAVPVEGANQKTADLLTKILLWNDRQENVLEILSECFLGACIGGLSLLQVYVDYREDPINGTIKVCEKAYNTFIIDPFFKQQDLSDCNGILVRTFVTRAQAMSLLPDRKDDLVNLVGMSNKDGKFPYMPENFSFNVKDLLTYDEFYYRDYRTQRLIVNPEDGKKMEWKGDEDQLKEYLAAYPNIEVVEQEIPTVRMTIVVQGRVMYDGPQSTGLDCFPFIPVLAYFTSASPYMSYRIQGIVRQLRDPQFLLNRRMVIELDIMESQVNSGWIAKENSFVDPEAPYKNGQGQVLWLKKSAQMTDVIQIRAPAVDASAFKISETLKSEMMVISGVSEELLGSASDDLAAILSKLRQGAALTTLQRLFDQLDLSQKLLAKIRIQLIQNNFTPAKVQDICQEPATEEFYSKNFGMYDIAVEDGFNTDTQKQMEFAQLVYLKQLGVNIPEEALIEAATLQNKDKLIAVLQQQRQQAQQMQQMQAQMEMQQQEATMKMAHARAASDIGLAVERNSRVQENQQLATERKAKSEKDKTDALLNFVKTLKELEGMDLDNLMQAIQMKHQIDDRVHAQALADQQMQQQAMMGMQQPNQGNPSINAQPPLMGQ